MSTTAEPMLVARPYAPSWADRLTERLERLGPVGWAMYVVVGVAVFLALTLAQWQAGTYPVGTIRLVHIAVAVAIPGYTWLVGHLARASRSAFQGLGPALRDDPAAAAVLEYRLTTLPADLALVTAFGFIVLSGVRFAIQPESLVNIGISLSTGSLVVSLSILALFAFVSGAFVAQVGHQTIQIHRILTRHVDIDLLDVSPLYAFSSVTARIAISLYLAGAVVLAAEPRTFSDPVGLGSGLLGVAVGVVVFVLPLLGVHGRLVAEKARYLAATAHRVEDVRAQLHQAVEARDLPAMGALNDAMTGLETEQRIIDRIPTWPWQPETLRWVVGALMFPVVLFVLQLLIARVAS